MWSSFTCHLLHSKQTTGNFFLLIVGSWDMMRFACTYNIWSPSKIFGIRLRNTVAPLCHWLTYQQNQWQLKWSGWTAQRSSFLKTEKKVCHKIFHLSALYWILLFVSLRLSIKILINLLKRKKYTHTHEYEILVNSKKKNFF